MNLNFDSILADEQWIDDATGLIPHCLAILKTCRFLTERLTTLAMNSTPLSGNFSQIVDSAKRISSRVDDMVRSMYPPLDPRLLEARAAALTLAVTHLALLTKYECGQKDKLGLQLIDKLLNDMDGHVHVSRRKQLLSVINTVFCAVSQRSVTLPRESQQQVSPVKQWTLKLNLNLCMFCRPCICR